MRKRADECERHSALLQAIVVLFFSILLAIFTRPLATWVFGEGSVRVWQNITAVFMGLQIAVTIYRWRGLSEDNHH